MEFVPLISSWIYFKTYEDTYHTFKMRVILLEAVHYLCLLSLNMFITLPF